ncbi:DNA methyltransferase [uncultured Chloroflexus sp.]|uniref:DNA methyltransferase n=1 Tax=uncultured Chloroflexus sp. TaxID=214040 RepID=UPI0026348367|nr:DNA methyltransferase [uncultured Chloroflexus sp.]
MTVGACQTVGLRRYPDGTPFANVIESERTPQRERVLADPPRLKPQSFLRQIVYAALPRGTEVILDPCMSSGSTIAAALAVGYPAIGIERNEQYYQRSLRAIPALTDLYPMQSTRLLHQ